MYLCRGFGSRTNSPPALNQALPGVQTLQNP